MCIYLLWVIHLLVKCVLTYCVQDLCKSRWSIGQMCTYLLCARSMQEPLIYWSNVYLLMMTNSGSLDCICACVCVCACVYFTDSWNLWRNKFKSSDCMYACIYVCVLCAHVCMYVYTSSLNPRIEIVEWAFGLFVMFAMWKALDLWICICTWLCLSMYMCMTLTIPCSQKTVNVLACEVSQCSMYTYIIHACMAHTCTWMWKCVFVYV